MFIRAQRLQPQLSLETVVVESVAVTGGRGDPLTANASHRRRSVSYDARVDHRAEGLCVTSRTAAVAAAGVAMEAGGTIAGFTKTLSAHPRVSRLPR